jgi:uncharacterized protein
MNKLKRLKAILKNLRSVIVAYSGGVDSTFLLKVAVDTLGRDNVVAVTARSETYPVSEYREARRFAKKIGARIITVHTEEMKDRRFKANPVNRCYYCKAELFKKLVRLAALHGKNAVIDGTNRDDLKDIRHGRRAAMECGIKSPLLDARLAKTDIRSLSRKMGLSTYDKPSFACLASRIPFGREISAEDLDMVDRAEDHLKRLGFKQVRVRLGADTARIEVMPKDLAAAVRLSGEISSGLKRLGFVYVTLDLAGYRTGSMHEAAIDKI